MRIFLRTWVLEISQLATMLVFDSPGILHAVIVLAALEAGSAYCLSRLSVLVGI